MSQCFRIRLMLSGPTRISSPGRQMVLAERTADGEDVGCYGSVAGWSTATTPRPAVEEVNARCAPLELFVGDLLAGELKDG
jgi:hypothetical protein